MREHRYSFVMPHSAARIWALFQDYDRWTDYGSALELVTDVEPEHGYTYTMISREPGNDQTG